MRMHSISASVLLAAFTTSRAYAGDPLIDLGVAVGNTQTFTDISGAFRLSGVKAGTHDIALTGNPVKPFLDADGGHRIELKINGKRVPLVCSSSGCVAKAVSTKGTVAGSVRLAN